MSEPFGRHDTLVYAAHVAFGALSVGHASPRHGEMFSRRLSNTSHAGNPEQKRRDAAYR